MENIKIITVDHDRAILDLLEDMLVVEGYVVQSYLGSSVDVTCLQQAQPDLIILELRRGYVDATVDLLDRLRQYPATRMTPVIVSSTDECLLHSMAVPLQQSGCLTLEKPFDIDQLLDCINQALTPPRIFNANEWIMTTTMLVL